MRRISGLPNPINHLSFYPDGRCLAASLHGKNGVRVFEVKSGSETGQDRDYGDHSYCIDFSRDGQRIVTTSNDDRIRLYALKNGALRKLEKAVAPGGKKPLSARFSLDGKRISQLGFRTRRQ